MLRTPSLDDKTVTTATPADDGSKLYICVCMCINYVKRSRNLGAPTRTTSAAQDK